MVFFSNTAGLLFWGVVQLALIDSGGLIHSALFKMKNDGRRDHHGRHRHRRQMDLFRNFPERNIVTNKSVLVSGGESAKEHVQRRATGNDDSASTPDFVGVVTTTEGDFSVDVTVMDTYGNLRTYPVIVDTGSSNFAIAVSECDTCSVGATELDLDLNVNYTIKVNYGESGSSTYWEGYRAYSNISFLNPTNGSALSAAAYMAGIVMTSEGSVAFFEGKNNKGIMGLAFDTLAQPYCYRAVATGYGCYHCAAAVDGSCEVPATPLFDTLYNTDSVDDNVFSLQFCGTPENPHGFLNLGGYELSHLASPINWTKCRQTAGLNDYGYWLSYMEGITINGERLDFDSGIFNDYGGVLVDSGTTEIKLPSDVLGSSVDDEGTLLYSLYKSYSGSMDKTLLREFLVKGSCVSKSDLKGFSNLQIDLDGGVQLEVEPVNYVLPCYYSSGSNKGDFADSYGIGIGAGDPPIIGNIALNGYVTVFDKGSHRIGFAKGNDCGTWYDGDNSSSRPWYFSTVAICVYIGLGTVLAGCAVSSFYRGKDAAKRSHQVDVRLAQTAAASAAYAESAQDYHKLVHELDSPPPHDTATDSQHDMATNVDVAATVESSPLVNNPVAEEPPPPIEVAVTTQTSV